MTEGPVVRTGFGTGGCSYFRVIDLESSASSPDNAGAPHPAIDDALVSSRSPQDLEAFGGIDGISEILGLSNLIEELAFERGLKKPLQIVRQPMELGLGSMSLNRVFVRDRYGRFLCLVEKVVDSNRRELSFWLESRSRRYVFDIPDIDIVQPILLVRFRRISVLYFDYRPNLDVSKSVASKEFVRSVPDIVRAVARFNVANILHNSPTSVFGKSFEQVRSRAPDSQLIQLHLGVSPSSAEALESEVLAIHRSLDMLAPMVRQLPYVLSHNDIGPGNAVRHNDTISILDFGQAGIGPLGSDLHTIFRWGSKGDREVTQRILSEYDRAVCEAGISIAMQDLELSAWATFFLRYTALHRWKSARSEDSFVRAVNEMRRVCKDRGLT